MRGKITLIFLILIIILKLPIAIQAIPNLKVNQVTKTHLSSYHYFIFYRLRNAGISDLKDAMFLTSTGFKGSG